MITGSPLKRYPLNAEGTKSCARTGVNWAVLADGTTNACGAGYRNVLFWDASDEFVYYIRSGHSSWESGALQFDGCLYIGSAADNDAYDAWMGAGHSVEISFVKDGTATLPKDHAPAAGKYLLENSYMKIAFGSEEQGFDCLGIENTAADGARFVNPHDALAGFWRLTFKGPANTNGVRESVTLDNHSPAEKRHVRKKSDELLFMWEGIDLPGEPASLDVTANISLNKAAGESNWHLNVKNRSKIYGLWQSDYPVLLSVVEPGRADLIAPCGNWGASLYKRFNGVLNLPYPSARCPVQCMAYQLGSAGLYIAAHDGAASAKSFVINSSQDVIIQQPAANAGVPGSAGAPEYLVVIAAYNGSWWEMARRYRRWALL